VACGQAQELEFVAVREEPAEEEVAVGFDAGAEDLADHAIAMDAEFEGQAGGERVLRLGAFEAQAAGEGATLLEDEGSEIDGVAAGFELLPAEGEGRQVRLAGILEQDGHLVAPGGQAADAGALAGEARLTGHQIVGAGFAIEQDEGDAGGAGGGGDRGEGGLGADGGDVGQDEVHALEAVAGLDVERGGLEDVAAAGIELQAGRAGGGGLGLGGVDDDLRAEVNLKDVAAFADVRDLVGAVGAGGLAEVEGAPAGLAVPGADANQEGRLGAGDGGAVGAQDAAGDGGGAAEAEVEVAQGFAPGEAHGTAAGAVETAVAFGVGADFVEAGLGGGEAVAARGIGLQDAEFDRARGGDVDTGDGLAGGGVGDAAFDGDWGRGSRGRLGERVAEIAGEYDEGDSAANILDSIHHSILPARTVGPSSDRSIGGPPAAGGRDPQEQRPVSSGIRFRADRTDAAF